MQPEQPITATPQAIQIGLEHHWAGRLSEAERIYRQVLQGEPDNAKALHLLGMIAHQVGKHAIAVEFISKALALNPDDAAAHSNMGLALKEQGKPVEAAASFLRAVGLNPNLAEAHSNLGLALNEQGRPAEAVACFHRALAIKPDYDTAHYNLGLALKQQGRLDEALASYRKALAIKPGYAEAHINVGVVLQEQGRLAEAATSFLDALAINADLAEAHNNLGSVLKEQGRLDGALASYRKALALNPGYVEAHCNMGAVLQAQGRLVEAVASYGKALALKPDYLEAHSNLGAVLQAQGKPVEAFASYRRALSISPDYSTAHNNLGNALKDQGRLEEALASYRKALELKPDYDVAHSNAIFVLDLMEGRSVYEQQEERQRWDARHARKYAESIVPYGNVVGAERKLRVGYVSADFCRHAASYAFGPIIRRHDRAAFEVVCYSGVALEDEVTSGLRQAAGAWHSTLGVSDQALADQIRRDRIDILVDLSAHMAGNRLLVFARKPAPVQVTAWGYPNGTGMQAIDYLLADPVVVPVEERALFSEEVIDLPCFLCYEPPAYLPEVAPLPALSGRPFTFGCISRIEKISDGALRLWGRILEAVPAARLLIKGIALEDPEYRKRFLGRLGAVGIGEARVRLIGHTSHLGLLQTFHEVDLALDPFPHGGAIGTAEALWMGVPVITIRGATFMSRISASILAALGMPGWIARDEEDYMRMAVQASRDLGGLAQTRAGMRSRLAGTIFGNAGSYTREVESAYRAMWRRWCEKH